MEYDMEAAFNAELARRLAANCGAAVDKVSHELKHVSLRMRWDSEAARAVVTAWYYGTSPEKISMGIGEPAAEVEQSVRHLAHRLEWRRRDELDKERAAKGDDDIPF